MSRGQGCGKRTWRGGKDALRVERWESNGMHRIREKAREEGYKERHGLGGGCTGKQERNRLWENQQN